LKKYHLSKKGICTAVRTAYQDLEIFSKENPEHLKNELENILSFIHLLDNRRVIEVIKNVTTFK